MYGPGSESVASLPTGRLRVPDHVVRRRFGDQTVMLNLHTGQYHGMNATGGRIVEVLQETGDLAATVSVVAGDFGVPPERVSADLARLWGSLLERGLVVEDE